MSTSVIEREPGGTPRRSTLKGTARKAAMVGVGISMLGSGMLVASTSASASDGPESDGVSIEDPTPSPSPTATPTGDPTQSVTFCHRESGEGLSFTKTTKPISEFAPRVSDGNHWKYSVASAFSNDIYPRLQGGTAPNEYSYLVTPKTGPVAWAHIDANGGNDGAYRLAHNCYSEREVHAAASASVEVCNAQLLPPYVKVDHVELSDVANPDGTPKGYANTVVGVYGQSVAYGNIVESRKANAYLSSDFAGANLPSGAAILVNECDTRGIVPFVPPVVPPVTNTVTVPGPTVTVTATPSVSPSAVAPVAVAPVAVAPVATPTKVPPVAVAPVAAAVPTAVNAGDGSSQNRPMSPVSIVLLALAGVGVLYAALKLSTRRRSTSSQ